MRLAASLGLVAVVSVSSCASSVTLTAAEKGDFPTLKTRVAAEEKVGKLTNGEAADLAHAVAAWEILKGPAAEQVERVREARACARSVDDALGRRMETDDAAGAEAALARVDAGEMSEGAARAHAKDASDGWRAVGARGLVREDDAADRRRAFADPAPAVRRAAMHAALVARDPKDVDALSEVARVDPELIVRTDAVRAMAAVGGEGVVAKLRDLWASADEPLREDIASAWASPAVSKSGGRAELVLLVRQARGAAAIEGAGAALRGPAEDTELRASATALLARVIGAGSARDRHHAIAVSPMPPPAPILQALREAAKDEDANLRVAALAALTSSAPDRDAAVRALEALAMDADRAAAASRAKLALASAGDARVQSLAEADLLAKDASTRVSAAMALADLGRSGRAAPLLADDDPSVRMRAACVLMTAPKR
jgi:hypothetical protein